jgi:hypothetical protein
MEIIARIAEDRYIKRDKNLKLDVALNKLFT